MKLNRSLLFLLSCVLILALMTGSVIAKEDVTNGRKQKVSKSLGLSGAWLDINLCEFGIRNDGMLAFDPDAGGYTGLWYPKGQRYGSVIFTAGLWIVGMVNGDVRSASCQYSTEYQPGAIMPDGTADDATADKYRIFKYNKPAAGEPSPVEAEAIAQGCPPEVIGDQMLWCVYNDLGTHEYLNDTNPLGVEVQQTTWGYNQTGALNNTVFIRYRVINKGGNQIDSTYLAIFYDPDLGDANDDASGADSTNGFGFVYNGDGYDDNYGVQVPAMASDFFQGPLVPSPGDVAELNDGRVLPDMKILPQTAVFHFINGSPIPGMGDPSTAEGQYYFCQGLLSNGNALIDPTNDKPTKFWLAGDPVTSSGWIWEDLVVPKDCRFGNSTGPFQLAAGDTQDIVLGIVCGMGSDNLNSITVMRYYDRSAQSAYDKNFNVPSPPPQPMVNTGQLDGKVILHWNADAATYSNAGYEFEGYNVWQGESSSGPWHLLTTYDKVNTTTVIWDFAYSAAVGTLLEMPVQKGADTGLQYSYTVNEDALTKTPLVNGKPYYFAVTGYAYNPDGTPKTLENSPVAVEAIPQRPVLDTEWAAIAGALIPTEHASGPSDGALIAEVIDPTAITGDDYAVSFYVQMDTNSVNYMHTVWKLTNVTTGDVILDDQIKQGTDPEDVDWPIVEGLRLRVMGPAMTVKLFSTVANAAGPIDPPESAGAPWKHFPLPTGVDPDGYVTDGQQVGDGHWMIHTWPNGNRGDFSDFMSRTFAYSGGYGTANQGIGALIPHDFEIRFTDMGKAVDYWGTEAVVDVPFELWDIGIATPGDASDDYKLIPYLYDYDGNGAYNLLWDAIFPDDDAGWADHETSSAANDPWTDPVYWMHPTNNTPGTVGFDDFMAAAAADPSELPAWYGGPGEHAGAYDAWAGMHRMVIVNWNGGDVTTATSDADYNQAMPETGTIFRIEMTKPNTPVDVFSFSTADYSALRGPAIAEKRIEDINVFPNPYFAHNNAEGTFYTQFVTFNNLPEDNTEIRIFSLNGELVKTISHTNMTPFERWYLLNEEDVPVASGMYFAHIDTEFGNVILKLAIINRGAFFRNL